MTQSSPDAALLRENGLSPCPFCGSEANAHSFIIEGAVWCVNCRATITRKHNAQDNAGFANAIEVWNRRAPSAENAVLHNALEQLVTVMDDGLQREREPRFGVSDFNNSLALAKAALQSPSPAAEYVEVERKLFEPLCDAPSKLHTLAGWVDVIDAQRGHSGTEVQDDLRRWANALRALLPTPAQREP